MKIEELMIGDWVYNTHHKKNIQITPYDFFTHGHLPSGKQYFIGEDPQIVSGKDLEPIPITGEILEKNGFKRSEVFVEWKYETDDVYMLCKPFPFIIITSNDVEMKFPCEYVHELQHALRLCEINKEIEL